MAFVAFSGAANAAVAFSAGAAKVAFVAFSGAANAAVAFSAGAARAAFVAFSGAANAAVAFSAGAPRAAFVAFSAGAAIAALVAFSAGAAIAALVAFSAGAAIAALVAFSTGAALERNLSSIEPFPSDFVCTFALVKRPGAFSLFLAANSGWLSVLIFLSDFSSFACSWAYETSGWVSLFARWSLTSACWGAGTFLPKTLSIMFWSTYLISPVFIFLVNYLHSLLRHLFI